MDLRVSVAIDAPIEVVWAAFNEPRSILCWDASPDWHTVSCTNDLRVGGFLNQRIEPRGHGEPTTFRARYISVVRLRLLEWETSDGQQVRVEFAERDGLVEVRQTFTADATVAVDDQRAEWQGVLDSFARYVERSVRLPGFEIDT